MSTRELDALFRHVVVFLDDFTADQFNRFIAFRMGNEHIIGRKMLPGPPPPSRLMREIATRQLFRHPDNYTGQWSGVRLSQVELYIMYLHKFGMFSKVGKIAIEFDLFIGEPGYCKSRLLMKQVTTLFYQQSFRVIKEERTDGHSTPTATK